MFKRFIPAMAGTNKIKTIGASSILIWLSWSISVSLIASINIPTFHLDGAFQTASGLYRLSADQYPGKNFYPYLGVGPTFALYPLFKAFGSDISASVFASHLVVLMVGTFATALIWHFIWRPASVITSLAAGTVLFLGQLGIYNYLSIQLPPWLQFSALPGNSLRPIRAAAPYLVAIIYFSLIHRMYGKAKRYALSGILAGITLLWSNDFAIPSAGLFAIFIFGNAIYRDELCPKTAAAFFISAASSWFLILSLATNGHPVDLLKYNFRDVASDQWWFFGPYAEKYRIFDFYDLIKLSTRDRLTKIYVPLLVLCLLAIYAFRTKRIEHSLLLFVGISLLAGGVAASVGGHLGGYLIAFYFWGMMVVYASLSRFIWVRYGDFWQNKDALLIRLFSVFIGISVLILYHSVDKLHSGRSSAANDGKRFFVPELGGYLENEWKGYIKLARETAQPVTEEYWGIWSATRRTFPDWPVDSVIHALGKTREVATENLDGAGLIISTKYSTSPTWQPWNFSQNYWFYERLVKGWSPYYHSPKTVIWTKDDSPRSFASADCSANDRGITLNATQAGFYELDIAYQFSGAGRFLTMMRNNISFGSDAEGYISLDPKGTNAKLPVYVKNPGATSFDMKVIGKGNYRFHIQSCSAIHIPAIDDDEALHAP